MRSHKRKGQAGTITWVKGWTSAVQQFLDSTIATIGQQDWKPRITYALQLATSLYKEHLLEDDQFLDWILKNIDNCPPERLFLWLLITSLYGQDLTASRRRGKRLADALLSHANKLYQFGEEIQASPLLEYLEKILLKLLATTPSCLLLPRTWDVNLPVLQHLVSRHPHTQVLSSVNDLDRRVKRLQHRLGAHSDSKDPTRRVISLLDSLEYVTAVDMERTACDCLATMPDAHTLVSTVLKWAASLYREGVHRIYLATRLLRRWCRSGVDVDSAILSYFLSPDSSQGCDPRNIFRIVAELIRSKNFSVGKYLQWLIATGSIHRNQDISSSSSWPLRLITEIPLTGLPEQVRNLRNTLLRGTPQCIEEEERTLDIAESTIRSQLQGLFGTEDIEDEGSSKCDVAHLHSTIKLELAYLLRHQVAANVQTLDRVPTKDPSVHESGQVCMITVKDFFTVRSYLESFGDLSMLADIVGIVATSLDSRVLTQATDTLLYHEKALRAIGAFESLFSRIATRYAVLRTVRIPEREFLLSLTELSLAAKGDSHLIQALRHDLSLCEQKNSLAACSPASDTMMEAASNPSIGSEEEIERVLTSGTTMDRQVMVRLFEKITFNLEDQMTKRSVPTGYHAMWFYRLRVFDENTFDIIVAERLTALLLNHRTATSQAILPALITSRCVALSNYVKIAGDCIRDRKAVDGIDALAICMDVLDLLLPSHELIASCQVGEAYRYRLEQWKLLYEAGNGILEVLGQMLELGAGSLPQTSQARLRHLLSDQRMQVFVKHFALKDLPSLCSALGLGMRSYSDATRLALKALADHLLDPSNRLRKCHFSSCAEHD
jgi:mediator of RNA polymerase II transcription subunit 12